MKTNRACHIPLVTSIQRPAMLPSRVAVSERAAGSARARASVSSWTLMVFWKSFGVGDFGDAEPPPFMEAENLLPHG